MIKPVMFVQNIKNIGMSRVLRRNDKMTKIVITGASGYIGQHVVDKAIEKGYDVVACDIVNSGMNPKAVFSNLNIFSGEKNIYEQLGSPDVCIHLAWQDGFSHNAESHMKNLNKHYEFLVDLADAGCKNIAVMGSMHEVGYWEGKIDEQTPCRPLSLYGVAKNALRQSLEIQAKNKKFNLYWLRAYYILGDDKRNHSIFTKLLEAAQDGKKVFPFTSGKNKYDFIDVSELAEMIVDASTQENYTGIINVCSGTPISLGDQVEAFIEKNSLDIALQYGAFPDRAYDSPVVYGDNTIICEIQKNMKRD